MLEIVPLEVVAGSDVAFALLRCGTSEELQKDPQNRLRLTIGHLSFARPGLPTLIPTLAHECLCTDTVTSVADEFSSHAYALLSSRHLLKDTGRKLAHVEKQLRTRDTIVRDLSERLAREE